MKSRVGTVKFVTYADTPPDIGLWLTALGKVPGFQDAHFNTAQPYLQDDKLVYKTDTTVELGSPTLSNRVTIVGALGLDVEPEPESEPEPEIEGN